MCGHTVIGEEEGELRRQEARGEGEMCRPAGGQEEGRLCGQGWRRRRVSGEGRQGGVSHQAGASPCGQAGRGGLTLAKKKAMTMSHIDSLVMPAITVCRGVVNTV